MLQLIIILSCLILRWPLGKCESREGQFPQLQAASPLFAGMSATACPTWTYSGPSFNNCVCGQSLGNIVICDPATLNLSVSVAIDYYCMFFSEEFNTTLIGSCPFSKRGKVSMNVSELKYRNGLCSYLHRKGELCGECEDNYTLPVYSYYLGCVKCEDYKYGWVKFIAAAFLPLTLFYFIVIVFRISATSPTLNGYILVSQIISTPPVILLMYTDYIIHLNNHQAKSECTFRRFLITIYSIWNLDFFRSFYKNLCLYPDISYQQVLILDYAVAVYPLLLILITYILVKLHDNFAIVVWLWRPFHECLVLFRKQWNIRSYLINALTTFIVLSYVKILNVSFQFLTPSSVYSMNGTRLNKAYWYYDGRVDLASKEHIPYLLLAVSMLVIFNIFPLILLTLYSLRCFQICLGRLSCVQCILTLKVFIDTFHGHYKDNMRLFASLYLAVRFLNLLFFTTLHYSLYFRVSILMFVLTLLLVARYRPYTCQKSNRIDSIMIFVMTGLSLQVIYTGDITDAEFYPRWFRLIVGFTLSLIPPCYVSYLVLVRVVSAVSWCINCHKLLAKKVRVTRRVDDIFKEERDEDEPLVHV